MKFWLALFVLVFSFHLSANETKPLNESLPMPTEAFSPQRNVYFYNPFPILWTSVTADEFKPTEENRQFIESMIISHLAFTTVNLLLFRRELQELRFGLLPIAAISAIEVAKNLVNYVNIEIRSEFLFPMISYSSLNYLRTFVPNAPHANTFGSIVEFALAELIKNKVNYEVTENWYPRSWLPDHHHAAEKSKWCEKEKAAAKE